jgi:plasmid maintenance system killer protein
VLSKSELIDAEQQKEIQTNLETALQQKVALISAATGYGLTGLLQAVWLELGIENP